MRHEGHLEIYRVAFEAANSELTEISAEFERLRILKNQIEQLVAVLTPLLDEAVEATPQTTVQVPEPRMDFKEPASEGNSQSEPFAADPFQRRTDHVLGIGAGIRDVRQYSRQF